MLRQRAAIAHPAHGTREIKSQLATSHYSSKTNLAMHSPLPRKGTVWHTLQMRMHWNILPCGL